MDNEIEKYHKQNTMLELNLADVRQKFCSTEEEVKELRITILNLQNFIGRVRTDLTFASENLQVSLMAAKKGEGGGGGQKIY